MLCPLANPFFFGCPISRRREEVSPSPSPSRLGGAAPPAIDLGFVWFPPPLLRLRVFVLHARSAVVAATVSSSCVSPSPPVVGASAFKCVTQ
uniref:Uncharacterized protein n=1 Tax=Leersia perrieri TaxID=77586 RepID=A0A0D9XBY0_9ORYZ